MNYPHLHPPKRVTDEGVNKFTPSLMIHYPWVEGVHLYILLFVFNFSIYTWHEIFFEVKLSIFHCTNISKVNLCIYVFHFAWCITKLHTTTTNAPKSWMASPCISLGFKAHILTMHFEFHFRVMVFIYALNLYSDVIFIICVKYFN